MADRLALQAELEGVLGSRNVYFQPPANIQMQYPCIVYERDGLSTYYADGNPYSKLRQYQLTLMDEDPDSEFFEKLANFPTSRFNRHFAVDQLNHDVFIIYY